MYMYLQGTGHLKYYWSFVSIRWINGSVTDNRGCGWSKDHHSLRTWDSWWKIACKKRAYKACNENVCYSFPHAFFPKWSVIVWFLLLDSVAWLMNAYRYVKDLRMAYCWLITNGKHLVELNLCGKCSHTVIHLYQRGLIVVPVVRQGLCWWRARKICPCTKSNSLSNFHQLKVCQLSTPILLNYRLRTFIF